MIAQVVIYAIFMLGLTIHTLDDRNEGMLLMVLLLNIIMFTYEIV